MTEASADTEGRVGAGPAQAPGPPAAGPHPAAGRPRAGGFAWLWAGESLSLLGTQVTLLAVPLAAVKTLHASSLDMGLVSAAGWAPIVVLGLVAGVWADRRDPWRIMLVGNVSRAVLITAIPVLAALHQLTLVALLISVAAVGIFSAFFDISCQTFVPELVDESALATANSRLELSRSVSYLAGPALAGLLVAALSAPTALWADALSFAMAALLLLPTASRSRATARRAAAAAAGEPAALVSSIWPDIRAGLRFVARHRMLRTIVTMAALANAFIAGAEALQILYGSRDLGLSAGIIGICVAGAGGGALLGATATPAVNKVIGESRTIAAGFLLTLAGVVFLALAPKAGAAWFFAAAQALFGFSNPLLNASLVTLRQKITPREILGRVNASARVLIMSSLPLGSLAFGALADAIGIRSTLLLVSGGLAAVCLLTAGPLLVRPASLTQ
jgi:MFS family permease